MYRKNGRRYWYLLHSVPDEILQQALFTEIGINKCNFLGTRLKDSLVNKMGSSREKSRILSYKESKLKKGRKYAR
jgi:hypothetical protein